MRAMADSRGLDLEQIASTAELIADPTRVRVLAALLAGPATVSELSAALNLPQPRVSTHMAVLSRAKVVTAEARGRQRIYRTDAESVARVFDALEQWRNHRTSGHRRGLRAAREVQRNSPLRQARMCYDHLAGVHGVELLDGLVARAWVQESQSPGARVQYRLTDLGSSRLRELDVDVDSALTARRLFAFACPDWTEDRPHLGGALGYQITQALRSSGALTRPSEARTIDLHVQPMAWLDSRL